MLGRRIGLIGLVLVGCGNTVEVVEPTGDPLPRFTGTWRLTITVPPDGPVRNDVAFTGSGGEGTFRDGFGDTGNWRMTGDSVFWEYTSVPDLVNEFRGVVDSALTTMEGVNGGRWQGRDFMGTWTGRKR